MKAYVWIRRSVERTRSTAPSILVSDPTGAVRLYGRTYEFDGEMILIYSAEPIETLTEQRTVAWALIFDGH